MKKILLTAIAIISLSTIHAQQSKDSSSDRILSKLNAEEMDELKREGVVFRLGRTRRGLFYTPETGLADNIVLRHDSIDPDVTVEAFFSVPYPYDMPETQIDRDLILYNIVREVSHISGVQYWSRTKERYRTLFEDVYVVGEDKKPLYDMPVFEIPEYDSFEIHMKEANLGRDYYLAEYRYDGRNMSFSLTNTSNVTFLLKVVGSENMQIDLLLMPGEEEILIYGYCGVKLANPGFVNKIMDPYSSFFRRLYAMEIWFENSLLGTETLPDKDILDRERG
ncbi:DUF6675 family protein [Spirochaeta isovalerica]|uniref:Uncharacterized protein n=1 Tax=Spirochaeta isovalerica TaxID=150 RepID=A0A841R551_9SPIO|nr:DUF6675 family protein [Spirochaeta isovalerica]MBB6478995.1 hypothetical protein [Spirochaeta isovalerica]